MSSSQRTWSRSAVAPLLLLGLAACGPGRVSSSGSDDQASDDASTTETDDSGSTDSNTSEPDPSESDSSEPDPSDSGPEPTGFVPEGDIICLTNFYCSGCDVFAQDCPEGEKCTPYASTGDSFDAEKCVVVAGDRMPGEACTYDGRVLATDDCDASSTCFDGLCRSFCTGTADNPSCAPGFGCTASYGTVPFTVCLPTCDPLAQDCVGDSCYWINDQFLCSPSGSIPFGEPCGFVNDCAGGSACVDGELIPNCIGSACCSPFCNLEQPDCASLPGTECVAWFDPGEAPAGLELLGSCLSP